MRSRGSPMGNWYLLVPHNQRKIYLEPTNTHDWWKVTLTMAARQHISRFALRGEADVKVIDRGVRNKWIWAWCDKSLCTGSPNEHLVGDCFRKLYEPGEAFCEWCEVTIKYGSSGCKALEQHALKYEKHQKIFKERRTNYQLPGGLKIMC